MSLFVAQAYADDAATSIGGAGGGLMSLLPMVLIFVIFYFLLIRPQMKKQKEQRNMVEALKKGDKVMAAGGIMGSIVNIEDGLALLEVASNIKIKVAKSSVTEVLNRKTAASSEKSSVAKTKSKSKSKKK